MNFLHRVCVYTRDWPIFAWTLRVNLFFLWDDETNRCVICHIKCQRVNRIIGWKKPVNRCGAGHSSKEHVSNAEARSNIETFSSFIEEQDLIEQVALVLMAGYHSTFSAFEIWHFGYLEKLLDHSLLQIEVSEVRGLYGRAKKCTLVS